MVPYGEPALGSLTMQQIQQQLQRIGTLVGIKQFDSARMQLREGPTSGLRRTLRGNRERFRWRQRLGESPSAFESPLLVSSLQF